MYKYYILLLIILCSNCHHSATEKHQTKRAHIVDVHDKVKEIKTGDVLLNSYCQVYAIDKYMVISDHKTPGNQIHLFNKNSFDYILGTAPIGQGPGEITVIGHIAEDTLRHQLLVSDFGKQRIFSYDLDSLLVDSAYLPNVKMILNQAEFPDRYDYLNDTLAFGPIIKPTGNYGFNQIAGKWNMQTGTIQLMKNIHPEIAKHRLCIAASFTHNRYVEAYIYHDLMSIRTLDGDLIYDIYGPDWDATNERYNYYGQVAFCKDKIVALYHNQTKPISQDKANRFLVFDLDGNYIKTLSLGYQINNFCYDKENHRLILSMDDEIQFGYLDLEGLID